MLTQAMKIKTTQINAAPSESTTPGTALNNA